MFPFPNPPRFTRVTPSRIQIIEDHPALETVLFVCFLPSVFAAYTSILQELS